MIKLAAKLPDLNQDLKSFCPSFDILVSSDSSQLSGVWLRGLKDITAISCSDHLMSCLKLMHQASGNFHV